MLILKNLTFKGIGRFSEQQSINVESLGNLIQVDGINKNTGGSSGAGKSTIFDALDFLFGINTKPNSILQSRLTDESISVEADFDLDGKTLTIARGKKLKIVLDGEVTTGSSKLTEEKLDQIIAIPRHLFRPMLHKVQGERGFFLNFTPKETNDFLTDCLGLGRFRKYIEDIDKRQIDLSNLIGSVISSLESAKSKLVALESAHNALGYPPKATVDRDSVLRVKNKSDFSNQQLKELLASQLEEKKALETVRPQIISLQFDVSAIKRLEEEISSIRKELESLEAQERQRVTEVQQRLYQYQLKISEINVSLERGIVAKEEARRVALEIKKIRDNFCPTCEQEWTNDGAKQKEQQLLKKIEELKALILTGQMAEVGIQEVQNRIASLSTESIPRLYDGPLLTKKKELEVFLVEEKKKESQHYSMETAVNKAKQDSFLKDQRDLFTKHEIALSQVRGQAELDRRTLEQAVYEMKAYEDARTRYETTSQTLKHQMNEQSLKIKEFSEQLEICKEKSTLFEELKKAVKSYLSCSFDEALEYISESATRMVRSVPNMANATIQLTGIRETKEGKVKEEVNALLHLDGDENIDIRTLCGGERSSIDLAVDLSVIELIENKTNKGINIFILDEGFTGLDTACIEMALEMLKNVNLDKKIIIVDHNPIIKEFVRDSVITVTREGLTSAISQL